MSSSTPAPAAFVSSAQAVSHVAALASQTIVSVTPSLSTDSIFTQPLRAAISAGNVWQDGSKAPRVIQANHSADPLLSLLTAVRNGQRSSLVGPSSILVPGVSHLYKLANTPVVLHIALGSDTDYTHISSVRQSGFLFLQSETLQDTLDLAATAHALAVQTGTGVIHFFNPSVIDTDASIINQSALLVYALQLNRDVAKLRPTEKHADDSLYVKGSGGPVATTIGTQSSTAPSSSALLGTVSSVISALPSTISSAVGTEPSTAAVSIDGREIGTPSSAATSVDQQGPRKQATSDDIWQVVSLVWTAIGQATGRLHRPFSFTGPADAKSAVVVFGTNPALVSKAVLSREGGEASVLTIKLYRPWLGAQLAEILPKTVTKIAVLEQASQSTTRWGPLLLDILTSLQTTGLAPKVVGYRAGYITESNASEVVNIVLDNLKLETPVQNLQIGPLEAPTKQETVNLPSQPGIENSYYKILQQLFPETLYLVNRATDADAGSVDASSFTSSPEFSLGSLLARIDGERNLLAHVKDILLTQKASLPDDLVAALSDWAVQQTASTPSSKANIDLANRIGSLLGASDSQVTKSLIERQHLFRPESRWIVGSDAWAYDIGNSGVHHLLASNKNVNMLIIDSTPLPKDGDHAIEAERRKKDIGLYAMNFGNAFVASVAVYSSYTHVLEAIVEAEKFDGPSIVLAYLPYSSETDSPLTVLQETKRAVDSGYWPLYRWDPTAESRDELNFRLDSERLRREYKNFLDRQNYLTQIIRRQPELAATLQTDFGHEVRELQKRQTKDAFAKLLDGLAGAPLTVLFAGDGGNAENVAKKIASRGKARGLKTILLAMDDYPFEDLASEENIAFVTSTAGQGEFPQNARSFWEALKGATDLDLSTQTRVAVFGLGDSHYWPRKDDKVYYNKPATDLFTRLSSLGATTLVETGLGDDQDPDGFQTGYNEWEPKLWEALGVAHVDGLPEEPAPVTMEDIKQESNFLRGTILEGLADKTTGAIAEHDQMLTKFHGTYIQDDRDIREQRKADGLEPAYSFMIRCRLPGGVATPRQWVQMDDIATSLGNDTMKLTTRQTFQFHGVVKGKLKPAMQAINRALMTTLAACGDVNRNVMCSSLPEQSSLHEQVQVVATKVSDHLLPATAAYHEIWLTDEKEGKKQIAGDALIDQEPMYGPTYLPRKFKITIAVPPHNDTDVYAHDIGLIAIKDESGSLAGFNVLIGGGMGVTHNNKKTYPQIGRMLGFTPADQTHLVCEKVMLVQRDDGDRKNRKHARLKYTVDDMGVDVFREKVETLLGWKLGPERAFAFTSNVDTYGWIKDERGLNHFTIFVENGRIENGSELQFKTGLRELALGLPSGAEFRLTGNQHVIVSNIRDDDLPQVKSLLAKYKLDNTAFSGLRLSSSACVAFPTCGLAMAESERYLPVLITKLESTLEEAGLKHDSIVMRMTGCPNGCARPWLAEIGLVGKAFEVYNLYLGGGYHGNRLSKLYRSNVREADILEILRPLIWRFSRERINEDERFGDFVIRAGVIVKTVEGRDFHADTAEDESE